MFAYTKLTAQVGDVRLGSLADIGERLGMSALCSKADMFSGGIDVR